MPRLHEQKFAVADLQLANTNRANVPWVVVGFHRCATLAAEMFMTLPRSLSSLAIVSIGCPMCLLQDSRVCGSLRRPRYTQSREGSPLARKLGILAHRRHALG